MQEIVLKSHRFRQEREASWRELEDILKRMERRGLGPLSDDEIMALPRLYQSTLASLSVARATSLDQNVIDYLESLSARAYYILYGSHERLPIRVAAFFSRLWPQAVQRMRLEVFISALCMALGVLIAFVLVQGNPDWYSAFVPDSMASGRTPLETTENLRDTLYHDAGTDGLSSFATFLFSHNARIAIFAFALGFAFGIPSTLLIIYNGLVLGAFIALFASRGLGFEVGGWLIIHGSTEIFAIILAGAAGLHIGRAIAFPGVLTRREAAGQAGQRAGLVMAGVVLMLFFASLLEGFGRQLVTHDFVRYGIGLSVLGLWCVYFFAPRKRFLEDTPDIEARS